MMFISSRSFTPAVVAACLIVCLGSSIVSADIAHRYSFDGDADDSIGTADGTLINNTGLSAYSDGQLTLGNNGTQSSNGSNGDYVDLPNGMISANGGQASYEFWLTWTDANRNTWEEFMSFGTSRDGEDTSNNATNSTYLMLTPRSGNTTKLRAGYRYGPTANEQVLDHASSMPRYQEVHVVFVWDEQRGRTALYVNGQLSDEGQPNFSIPTDLVDNNNWLGRSQWPDPMFVGSFNEVRIYNHALSTADVKATFDAGIDNTPAMMPHPADEAGAVAADSVLKWTRGQILSSTLAGYDVYFGTDAAAVINADSSDTTGVYIGRLSAATTSWMPAESLPSATTYYWRVDEVLADTEIKGAIWSFSTFGNWEMKQAVLMTPWAEDVDKENVLPEYPRPQMVRADWLNLNGLWLYKPATAADSIPVEEAYIGQILVPFPVESAISGVMESYNRLWYRRTFDVPAGWQGQQILLHFNACDWQTEVFINGQAVGSHQGGYDPFSFDITEYLNASGPQELAVRVYDPTDSEAIALGKQRNSPSGIWYTPCTGIWDTVWLEPVPQASIQKLTLTPDIDSHLLYVTAEVDSANPDSLTIQAIAKIDGQTVGQISGPANQLLSLSVSDLRLWTPESPFLYDLELTLLDGQTVVDSVASYFGMRKIELIDQDGFKRIALNGKYIFQMGPLDQGYWPEGIYRAPTDEALKWDIEQVKAYGYNMLRKHVKVEPPRWYYWADKLGVLVWQDMPSRASSGDSASQMQFELELERMVDQLHNHPSIIMWVVFNEGWGQYDTERVTSWVMGLDTSRLVSCASGWNDYEVGHIRDSHSYPAPAAPDASSTRALVNGEYGGIGYAIIDHLWDPDSWGYTTVTSSEQLERLYEQYYNQLLGLNNTRGINAGVYTQLTDVETEINGLITYDRKVIKASQSYLNNIHSFTSAGASSVAVPTSEAAAQSWRYVIEQPADDWFATTFNDTSWLQGSGGFGTATTPGSVVGTVWNTTDIWLRQTFTGPALTAEDMERLQLRIHHDEDVEVYLNGVLAFTGGGYTTSYGEVNMSDEARAAFLPGQTNVLAVHCHQTAGGQYIDAGLSIRGCRCLRVGCYDTDGDCLLTLTDLDVFVSRWMDDYGLSDFDVLAEQWHLCQ
ncbi:MAG: LamG-like jellyroll fold domain-containing protein [Anaerohalosphaeraceae bacterium]